MQSDFDSRFAFSTLANVFIELSASNGSNYTFFIKEIKKKNSQWAYKSIRTNVLIYLVTQD